MKLKEILKVIYREDLNQPVKLHIVEASGYLTRYAKCYKDALEFATEYKDCEVFGVHAEQALEEPVICISIENFDF
jgi:hypothetical protein